MDTREDLTFLECRACESGRYSARLDDANGVTQECKLCEAGKSQSAGAALQCDPCQPGEYQNNTGSRACDRCKIGSYQDQRAARMCTSCPGDGTTLGFGSVSQDDCGCPAEYIQVGPDALRCSKCPEGLSCPALATLASFVDGDSEMGEQFVARVEVDFYSTWDAPLELYRCVGSLRCPGGLPGSCSGGLEGIACTDCPSGKIWDFDSCQDCTLWNQLRWIVGLLATMLGLVLAYYLLTSQATSKASVLFTTTCVFAMTISALQSVAGLSFGAIDFIVLKGKLFVDSLQLAKTMRTQVAIIGMMTVEFPEALKGIYAFMQIFLLDLDTLAFGCIAGSSGPARYVVSVLFFPMSVAWVAACFGVSKLFAARHRWEAAKTKSTIGAFLQVTFSTMSTVAMSPMTCFSHPNGKYSILKYPGITCGTEEKLGGCKMIPRAGVQLVSCFAKLLFYFTACFFPRSRSTLSCW